MIESLKNHVRVIDNDRVQKVEFYDEYGVKLVLNKSDLSDSAWNEFKNTFRTF